jgi:acylphosphatase
VQGVGFRAYVARIAESLGMHGEVWNTRDGAVEGHAQGTRTEVFIAMLSKGPGWVDGVASTPAEARDYSNFSITETR